MNCELTKTPGIGANMAEHLIWAGYFERGEAVGEWITYDAAGKPYKRTQRG
jgi:hypothetical protein